MNEKIDFSKELEKEFGWPRISLTNSGSSANLAASLALSEKCMEQDKKNNIQRNDNILGEALTAGFTFPSTMSSLLAGLILIFSVNYKYI